MSDPLKPISSRQPPTSVSEISDVNQTSQSGTKKAQFKEALDAVAQTDQASAVSPASDPSLSTEDVLNQVLSSPMVSQLSAEQRQTLEISLRGAIEQDPHLQTLTKALK